VITAEVRDGDGCWQLTITGHSDASACAAITAMEQTVAIWLDQLSELNPAALTFIYAQEASPHESPSLGAGGRRSRRRLRRSIPDQS
jgi:uncharacterized protein YsxB (DUF464 family)